MGRGQEESWEEGIAIFCQEVMESFLNETVFDQREFKDV